MGLAVARAMPPSPRYTSPALAPLTGLVVRAELDPRPYQRGIAVLRAAGEFGGAGGLAGAKVPVSSSQPCRAFVAAGAATAATPRSRAVTRHPQVHVWITIWRRHGRDPFRIFSPPSLPTASVLVTGGGATRVSPRTSLAPHPDPAYMHSSSTSLVHSPLTLVISPGLA